MGSGPFESGLVGFSTGAIDRDDLSSALEVARNEAMAICELSALRLGELDGLCDLVADGVVGFERVSVHGPAKELVGDNARLADRLAKLGTDVVMHPDCLGERSSWQQWSVLGSSLLIENNDSRKAWGRSIVDLDSVFGELGKASFCLDVSHALDSGGRDLVPALAGRYRQRLVQVHIGCRCGGARDELLEPGELEALGAVWSVIGRRVPVLIERPAGTRELRSALIAQVNGV
jgi:hypothetical protein